MGGVNIESFTRLLQLSISPVVIISAVGLLLLSVTNRLGRAIDRSRDVTAGLHEGRIPNGRDIREQLRILLRRCELLRNSIVLLIGSISFSCLMILFLFVLIFWEINIEVSGARRRSR